MKEEQPDQQLPTAEAVLMLIVKEHGPISGYSTQRLVDEAGYREWAGIGSTSIYSGLKKLHAKGLVQTIRSEKRQARRRLSTRRPRTATKPSCFSCAMPCPAPGSATRCST